MSIIKGGRLNAIIERKRKTMHLCIDKITTGSTSPIIVEDLNTVVLKLSGASGIVSGVIRFEARAYADDPVYYPIAGVNLKDLSVGWETELTTFGNNRTQVWRFDVSGLYSIRAWIVSIDGASISIHAGGAS